MRLSSRRIRAGGGRERGGAVGYGPAPRSRIEGAVRHLLADTVGLAIPRSYVPTQRCYRGTGHPWAMGRRSVGSTVDGVWLSKDRHSSVVHHADGGRAYIDEARLRHETSGGSTVLLAQPRRSVPAICTEVASGDRSSSRTHTCRSTPDGSTEYYYLVVLYVQRRLKDSTGSCDRMDHVVEHLPSRVPLACLARPGVLAESQPLPTRHPSARSPNGIPVGRYRSVLGNPGVPG